jgi:SAM-dependent methyltransferase
VTENAQDAAAVFGRAAATYETVVPFFNRFGERLVAMVDPRPGERVVDLACGRGATLIPTAERVGPSGSVVGVDLAPEMVDLLATDLAEQGIANASVRRMELHSLDLADESFDVAIFGFVLHLVPDPVGAAMECRRVLRPNGRCAASVPLGAGASWDFLGDLFRSFAPRALRPPGVPFRPDFDLDQVLRSAGFDILRAADEEIDIVFANEQVWWDWAWSAGMRSLLEVLPPDALEELRVALFKELRDRATDGGLTMAQRARFVIGAR